MSKVVKQKKIPLRRCVATQEQFPKRELIRVVRTPEGNVVIDLVGKVNGRGAYLSRSVNAIEIARKKKILDRHLEVSVGEEIYTELLKIVSEGK